MSQAGVVARAKGGNAGRSAEAEVLRLAGLARRAGRLAIGTSAVRQATRSGALHAVLFASDATENARDRLAGGLAAAGVPTATCGDRETLGLAVGRPGVVVIGIMEPHLARRALDALGGERPGRAGDPGGREPGREERERKV
jgi:ribosomal protein L7Ae-like RNA K-turn-binding protein